MAQRAINKFSQCQKWTQIWGKKVFLLEFHVSFLLRTLLFLAEYLWLFCCTSMDILMYRQVNLSSEDNIQANTEALFLLALFFPCDSLSLLCYEAILMQIGGRNAVIFGKPSHFCKPTSHKKLTNTAVHEFKRVVTKSCANLIFIYLYNIY